LIEETSSKVTKATAGKGAIANIDDFVPDEEIDSNFLTEEGEEEHNKLFSKERLVILTNKMKYTVFIQHILFETKVYEAFDCSFKLCTFCCCTFSVM